MKLTRTQQFWRIEGAFSGWQGTLEELAHECGYRVGVLCEILGCSQRHLYNVFLRDVGIPPNKWLDSERMVLARRKLVGGQSIRHVTEELGYSSVVSFSRRFEKIHGVPPGRFVKGHDLFDPSRLEEDEPDYEDRS